jgi:tRNA dimethylallyltransferase
MKPKKPRAIFIVGPTASGKSELAMDLAESFGGEIINGDSVQVFDRVNIGSAKPLKEDLSRVPHHLFGHVKTGESYTAGDYRRDAIAAMEDGVSRGIETFFVVGGSGFYIQALSQGMFSVPGGNDSVRHEMTRKLESRGLEPLYDELLGLDADYAQKIGPKDSYRIQRALEILKSTSFTNMAEVKKEFKVQVNPFDCCFLGVRCSREKLRKKVQIRTNSMINRGLVQETKDLLKDNLGTWSPLKSVGYKEVVEHLDGQYDQNELAQRIIASTMKLAKKQMTWFRRDNRIHWFDMTLSKAAPRIFLEEVLS